MPAATNCSPGLCEPWRGRSGGVLVPWPCLPGSLLSSLCPPGLLPPWRPKGGCSTTTLLPGHQKPPANQKSVFCWDHPAPTHSFILSSSSTSEHLQTATLRLSRALPGQTRRSAASPAQTDPPFPDCPCPCSRLISFSLNTGNQSTLVQVRLHHCLVQRH